MEEGGGQGGEGEGGGEDTWAPTPDTPPPPINPSTPPSPLTPHNNPYIPNPHRKAPLIGFSPMKLFTSCLTPLPPAPSHFTIWPPLQRPYMRETMHSALNLECTIRAQLTSATRGRASQPKVLAMATDCSVTCQQG